MVRIITKIIKQSCFNIDKKDETFTLFDEMCNSPVFQVSLFKNSFTFHPFQSHSISVFPLLEYAGLQYFLLLLFFLSDSVNVCSFS